LWQNVNRGALLLYEKFIASCLYRRGQTPLCLAVESKDVAIIKLLHSATQEVPEVMEEESGRTPLFRAAQNNSKEMVKALLDCGVNPNTKDIFRVTPLM
jgi:ankyrin repeat protein